MQSFEMWPKYQINLQNCCLFWQLLEKGTQEQYACCIDFPMGKPSKKTKKTTKRYIPSDRRPFIKPSFRILQEAVTRRSHSYSPFGPATTPPGPQQCYRALGYADSPFRLHPSAPAPPAGPQGGALHEGCLA